MMIMMIEMKKTNSFTMKKKKEKISTIQLFDITSKKVKPVKSKRWFNVVGVLNPPRTIFDISVKILKDIFEIREKDLKIKIVNLYDSSELDFTLKKIFFDARGWVLELDYRDKKKECIEIRLDECLAEQIRIMVLLKPE